MYFQRFSWILIFLAGVIIPLSGCMVGPDFHSPEAPKTDRYTASPLPKKTASTSSLGSAGQSQSFILGQDIPRAWWTLYRSPELNHLITRGLMNNPTLASAEATLRQAKETFNAQTGSLLFPAFDATLSGERQSITNATFGTDSDIPSSVFNLYNASVSVSYTFDLFGGSRRQLESLAAQVDYQRFQLLAAYLTLTSNIVTTAITTSALQAEIEATQSLITAEENQLNIMKRQLYLGGISGANVFAQETQVAQTRALLPPLEKNLAQARHALAVLVGTLPSESELPKIDLNQLHLPNSLPVSLPAALVQQRPDVRGSEALLHSASAQVGVATAQLFPQITLSASYGFSSATTSNLFSPTNNVWNYGGQILQPIFHAGALQAERRAAIAAYEAANTNYRHVVLQAFQNVADTLRALETDARALRAEREAEVAARNTLKITKNQLRLGGVSYLDVLNAEQQYQQTHIHRIQAEAARYADTAALFQALGGGWWNRTSPSTGDHT